MSRFLTMALAIVAALGLHLAPAAAGSWSPLLAPAELEALTDGDDVLLIDIRSVKAYSEGHVEGAISSPYHAWRGPEENPGRLIGADKLTLNLQQIGIEPDSRVVVTYQGRDASDFGAAARVYWSIRSAGVERVAILNGGINAWTAAGFPLSTAEAANFPSDAEFEFSDRWLADRGEVAQVVAGEGESLLVDARPLEFFEGRVKHPAAYRAGSLPRAVRLTFASWFRSEDPLFRADPEAIRERARAAGWEPGAPIVSFCNTGHWAAINWFALSEIAGIEDVKLYPESMVGWTLTHES